MTLDVESIVYTFYLLGGTCSVYEQCSQELGDVRPPAARVLCYPSYRRGNMSSNHKQLA